MSYDLIATLYEEFKGYRIQIMSSVSITVFLEANLDLNHTFFFGEAGFHLSGYVNSQTSRTWSEFNPFELHEFLLRSSKVEFRVR